MPKTDNKDIVKALRSVADKLEQDIKVDYVFSYQVTDAGEMRGSAGGNTLTAAYMASHMLETLKSELR